jgi:hypothetical protein
MAIFNQPMDTFIYTRPSIPAWKNIINSCRMIDAFPAFPAAPSSLIKFPRDSRNFEVTR